LVVQLLKKSQELALSAANSWLLQFGVFGGHYVNGAPLSPDQIQFLVDRALIHAEVLKKAIKP